MEPTDDQLLAYLSQYLPDNDDELITPSALRYVLAGFVQGKVNRNTLAIFAELASPRFTGTPQVPTAPAGTNTEQAASTAFVLSAIATITSGKNLSELALPQTVQSGFWYLTGNGIWEARRTFAAAADPANGPNWRLVASFTGQLTSVTAANIFDATEAGRAMLTAANASVQRGLVNNPKIQAGQYGDHPGFSSEDGPAGAWAWVIKMIVALASRQMVAIPDAPTNGQVNDSAKEFTFKINPAYPSYAQYKEAGRPGTTASAYLSAATAYQVGDTVHVTGLAGAGKLSLAYYVAGSGILPDGKVLTNTEGFSGTPAVVTPPTPTLTAALAISLATLTLGSPVAYTITPAGGTAPYAYEIVATDNVTGQQFTLGTNKTGSWTPTIAGSYAIDAAVTDGSAPSQRAEAITRYLQVTQAANRIPVTDAGEDAVVQLPTSSLALMGRATDPDSGDTIATHAWRQITGPASATGLPATTQNVLVSGLVAGTYQFGYRATDSHGAQSSEDFILVTVLAATTSPAPSGKSLNIGLGDSIMRADQATLAAGFPANTGTSAVQQSQGAVGNVGRQSHIEQATDILLADYPN
jgi:hypothetical protein